MDAQGFPLPGWKITGVLSSGVDLLEEVLKGKVLLRVRHSGRLHELHVPVLLAQLLGFLLRYLSELLIILNKVDFVTHEHDADVLLG